MLGKPGTYSGIQIKTNLYYLITNEKVSLTSLARP
jgi:hypothetical protein